LKRRALIIFCDNTSSGPLPGPSSDFENYNTYLQSKTGGEWHPDEIMGLHNPRIAQVKYAVSNFMAGAKYAMIIFTGHGCIDADNKSCLEVFDGEVRIKDIKPDSPRKTIVIDACREKVAPTTIEPETRVFSKMMESVLELPSTRSLFDRYVLSAPEGLSILYAASENQSALDTPNGAAYLISLLKVAENWRDSGNTSMVLTIKEAHLLAASYLEENFEETDQIPKILSEKRTTYFPFAVKMVPLNS